MRVVTLWFDRLLQAVTLSLLVLLTLIVMAGITFRYSGNSLIWYDEASSMLLAWITFTGAALAMNRNAHLGFNGLMFGLPLSGRLVLFWLVEAIVIGSFAIMAWAGWAILEIFGDETLTSLRAFHRSFVQSVLPISCVMIILSRLLTMPGRLADIRSGNDPEMAEIEEEIAKAEAEMARIRTGVPEMIEALVLLSMFLMIAIGVPIAVAILASSLLGVFALNGALGFLNAALSIFDGATSFPLIAIPLFVLAGALMNTGGISTRLIAFVSALIGFVRGGLAMVNVGVSLFFAEISGSAVADVAATGSVLIPAMKRKGYSSRFAAAITSSSASLAIIIPPSIPMILYGALSDTSIVQLFVAGIIPGLLGAAGMMALSYYFAVRYDLPREEAFSLCRLWQTTKDAAFALILPVIILGGIFGGVVTATEGAALAVLAALVIGVFIYREITIARLYHALVDGVVQTSVVMLLVAASAVLGLYLIETGLPQRLAAEITDITTNKLVVLMIINVFLLFIGMVLHGAAAIILTVPIFMPLVHQLGIDPVQFGILITLNIALGQQTPPVASVLVTACSIAKTDVWGTTRTNLPFIGILVAVLLLVTYVPTVPLFLVEYFYR